jgi:hypothetical protein
LSAAGAPLFAAGYRGAGLAGARMIAGLQHRPKYGTQTLVPSPLAMHRS